MAFVLSGLSIADSFADSFTDSFADKDYYVIVISMLKAMYHKPHFIFSNRNKNNSRMFSSI